MLDTRTETGSDVDALETEAARPCRCTTVPSATFCRPHTPPRHDGALPVELDGGAVRPAAAGVRDGSRHLPKPSRRMSPPAAPSSLRTVAEPTAVSQRARRDLDDRAGADGAERRGRRSARCPRRRWSRSGSRTGAGSCPAGRRRRPVTGAPAGVEHLEGGRPQARDLDVRARHHLARHAQRRTLVEPERRPSGLTAWIAPRRRAERDAQRARRRRASRRASPRRCPRPRRRRIGEPSKRFTRARHRRRSSRSPGSRSRGSGRASGRPRCCP